MIAPALQAPAAVAITIPACIAGAMAAGIRTLLSTLTVLQVYGCCWTRPHQAWTAVGHMPGSVAACLVNIWMGLGAMHLESTENNATL
jgi:hypothetical protein